MDHAPDAADPLPTHIQEGVQAIAKLHQDHKARASGIQRAFSAVRGHLARPRFIAEVTVVVAAWLGLNLGLMALGRPAIDPPPFNGLQVALALAAVYITSLILSAQSHDDLLASHREQLTLELALLSERKSAKIIALLEELRRDHPELQDREDLEALAMARPADTAVVLAALTERTEAGAIPSASEGADASGAEGDESRLQPNLL